MRKEKGATAPAQVQVSLEHVPADLLTAYLDVAKARRTLAGVADHFAARRDSFAESQTKTSDDALADAGCEILQLLSWAIHHPD